MNPYTSKQDRRKAKIIDAYIRDNLNKPLETSVLTRQFGISEFTLKRIFKVVFHAPVHQYIRSARLKKARQLLLHTDMPVKQIAGMVGFRSISSFIRAFRKAFRTTPGDMRKG